MIFISNLINNINKHPLVKRWSVKYPRTFQFILERLSLNKFEGLPLTLFLAIFVANLALFNELAESIVNSPLLLGIDNSFAQFLFKIRNNTVANSFYYFSLLGSAYVVIPLSIIIITILIRKRRIASLISLLISLVGIITTDVLGKLYFHRIRPIDYSFYKEVSYSFPSGHSIVSVAFYGLIFYMIIRHRKKHKVRWTAFAISFILLLGFSRLYMCVHFLSDVLAGYSLGLLWLLLSISIIEWKSGKST